MVLIFLFISSISLLLPANAEDIVWKLDSWTPISISSISTIDPTITLCQLNFKDYYESPHTHSKFKDFVRKSKCKGDNSRNEKMSVLKKMMKSENLAAESGPAQRFLKPSGFIFHESRVGSTLVANMLASDPYSMVFSESAPPAKALRKSGSREERITFFRDIVSLMGATSMHKHLFFKFQSILSTHMDIILEVIECM